MSLSLMNFALLLFTLFIPTLAAAAEAYRHVPSGFECPVELARFTLTEVYDYETQRPGQGVSCTYVAKDAPYGADIYLFNNGLKSVPADISNPVVVQLRERTLKDIEQSARNHGETARIADQAVLTADTGRGTILAYYDALTITTPKAPLTTWVWLWTAHNHFVKIRMTRAGQGSLSPRRAREFFEAVAKLVPE
jgi:hypothetical protein